MGNKFVWECMGVGWVGRERGGGGVGRGGYYTGGGEDSVILR